MHLRPKVKITTILTSPTCSQSKTLARWLCTMARWDIRVQELKQTNQQLSTKMTQMASCLTLKHSIASHHSYTRLTRKQELRLQIIGSHHLATITWPLWTISLSVLRIRQFLPPRIATLRRSIAICTMVLPQAGLSKLRPFNQLVSVAILNPINKFSTSKDNRIMARVKVNIDSVTMRHPLKKIKRWFSSKTTWKAKTASLLHTITRRKIGTKQGTSCTKCVNSLTNHTVVQVRWVEMSKTFQIWLTGLIDLEAKRPRSWPSNHRIMDSCRCSNSNLDSHQFYSKISNSITILVGESTRQMCMNTSSTSSQTIRMALNMTKEGQWTLFHRWQIRSALRSTTRLHLMAHRPLCLSQKSASIT